MATDEQLDRLAAAAIARRQTAQVIAENNDSTELMRQGASALVAQEAEYTAALADAVAAT